jgi:hypothetical protein
VTAPHFAEQTSTAPESVLGHESRCTTTRSAREILVSRNVRDLVVGSGTGFEDRGSVELRGVPDTWQLLAVNRHGPPGRIGRGGTGVNAHPRTADRDAPVGPRRRNNGKADAVDPARDGPPRPGHRSPLNPLGYGR